MKYMTWQSGGARVPALWGRTFAGQFAQVARDKCRTAFALTGVQTHTKTAQEAGSGCRSQQRLGTPTSARKVCNGGGSRQRLGKLATIGEAGAGWGSRQRLGNRRWLGKLATAREAGTWGGCFKIGVSFNRVRPEIVEIGIGCVSSCGVLEWRVSPKTMSRNMVSRDF